MLPEENLQICGILPVFDANNNKLLLTNGQRKIVYEKSSAICMDNACNAVNIQSEKISLHADSDKKNTAHKHEITPEERSLLEVCGKENAKKVYIEKQILPYCDTQLKLCGVCRDNNYAAFESIYSFRKK